MINLINGDCLDTINQMLKDGIKVDCIVTDPPYKTTKRGSSGGTGGILKDKLNMQGKVFKHNDIKFNEWLPKCYEVLKESGHAYFMTNNKNLKNMLIEVENAGFKIFKVIPWFKDNVITNMYYMDCVEFVIFCRKGKAKRINNCGSKAAFFFKNPKNKEHPSEKPVELFEEMILNSSQENELIFEPFGGVGACAIACKKNNRNCIFCELDEVYFKKAQERLNKNEIQGE